MMSRLLFIALVPVVLGAAAAAQPKQARVTLPASMLGVWGADAEACKGEPIEAENRLEVAQDGLQFYVTAYGVRSWQVKGKSYTARASIAEEGEGPSSARVTVTLRLMPDGKLELKTTRNHSGTYVKCPAGTTIR